MRLVAAIRSEVSRRQSCDFGLCFVLYVNREDASFTRARGNHHPQCPSPVEVHPATGVVVYTLRVLVTSKKTRGPLAQRLVQRTHNPLVVGSNPTGPTIKSISC
jgi:hypothetical protein